MAEEREPGVFSVKSLYKLSASAVAERFVVYKERLSYLPPSMLFDIYYQLYEWKRLCLLGMELSNLETFSKMLSVTNRRVHLLQIFQALMDHGTRIAKELTISYNICGIKTDPATEDKVINLGLRLGQFLSDAGWYAESEQVLLTCKGLCLADNKTAPHWFRTLQCCRRLLHAQAMYYSLKRANETFLLALEMIEKLEEAGYDPVNFAAIYTECSLLYFVRSEYDETYSFGIEALKLLKPTLPPRVIIDTLRQTAKACVMKRQFQRAGLLIREAVYLAREVFGTEHPKYSDVLSDYGFYWVNYDNMLNSVTVYKNALSIRKAIFGKSSLLVALTHGDLAYALYVYEYTSGTFQVASDHAEKAIEIMDKLLPEDHLMQSSAKRIKALILEEIALLNPHTMTGGEDLLHKSLLLQMSALESVKNAFGERNVQTAKHYGNLGRLFQSMREYEKSEKMHLKAISIKEELLGTEDHEVGLSIGHLASLYSFHMNRYRDAERLYHRSIAIGLKLFGEAYSGLEYDYRGLLNVYTNLIEHDKFRQYAQALADWKQLRDKHTQSEGPPIDLQKRPMPIERVLEMFLSM